VDLSLIQKIKSAVVGIGLIDIKKDPNITGFEIIGGSGFIIDKEGVFVTATHVITALLSKRKEFAEGGKQTQLSLFHFTEVKDYVACRIMPFEEPGYITGTHKKTKQKMDPDIAVGKVFDSVGNLPYLEIANKPTLKIFDEILVCGYPGGKATLNLKIGSFEGRTAPLIQYGRISGLIPTDVAEKPYGIQTDVIGTGGSSGSPIVAVNTGHVVGISQNVIGGNVFHMTEEGYSPFGITNVGMIYGVSSHSLSGISSIIDALKKGVRTVDDLPFDTTYFKEGKFFKRPT